MKASTPDDRILPVTRYVLAVVIVALVIAFLIFISTQIQPKSVSPGRLTPH